MALQALLVGESPATEREIEMQEDSIAVPDSSRSVLVVGHYCHDTIRRTTGDTFEALGGSVSYITNVFDALRISTCVVSKVGSDFAYQEAVARHTPILLPLQSTTHFFADFSINKERILITGPICEPIYPSDISSHYHQRFFLGLAVGVAGEISVETLAAMADVSDLLIADIQALIRKIDPFTGSVSLANLEETPFYCLLERISYLKAACNEAQHIDIDAVRKQTCLIVTEGKLGCTIYFKDRHVCIPAFEAEEVDLTGAGDSFLAGFSAGLYSGFSIERAALMGNYFGALTVGQMGVPKFSALHLQNMHRIMDSRIDDVIKGSMRDGQIDRSMSTYY